MESLPEFTVCEECYEAVIWPLIEDPNASEIPRNFIRTRQPRPVAACQLYSDRMREVFRRACRRNGMGYLVVKVRERQRVEDEIKARYLELLERDQNDPAVQRERAELTRRLKEIE